MAFGDWILQPFKKAEKAKPTPVQKTIPVARNGPQTVSQAYVMDPKGMKTIDQYITFVRQLEARYPHSTGFDLNRAVRQYFYSGSGRRNSDDHFDDWLGTSGGHNCPELKDIDRKLQDLPPVLTDPQGKKINIAHMVVGIDGFYNRRMGIHGVWHTPTDALYRYLLTDGGDYGQVLIGSGLYVMKKIGIDIDGADDKWDAVVSRASSDQLAGNTDGVEIGDDMKKEDKYSTALYRYYHGEKQRNEDIARMRLEMQMRYGMGF